MDSSRKRPRSQEATSLEQPVEKSLALIEPRWRRWALYELVDLENRTNYFRISQRPLTPRIEDDLELVSGVVSKEEFRHFWDKGSYHCAQCDNLLYKSEDKWRGPCIWPSFRRSANEKSSLLHVPVEKYNNYTCVVEEVYCKKCELFLGHAFEDGVAKGDSHPDARWRH